MIAVRLGDLAAVQADAVLRPVTSEWTAPTPAMRRLEVAAGAEVEAWCRRLGELPVGSAVVTPAGALPVEYLVHVVIRSPEQPVTADGVRRALRNGLRRLADWGVASVALPPLGTGAGNLDADESAELMVPILVEHLGAGTLPDRVAIVVESEYERDVFERQLERHAPPAGGSRTSAAAERAQASLPASAPRADVPDA
jgi:O-acetyl-ADP-ribose deacetylase (regulator of RNase III)